MNTPTQRPVHRNIAVTDLARYRLPAPGVASILHRISGVALFVLLPVILGLLQMSLKSEVGFTALRNMVWGNFVGKLVLIGLLWALIYHTLAGVRHMIQDGNKWLDAETSKNTALATIGASLALTLLAAWRLW
jgi:succinate dehydrogenase / fumarate reductase, cytochrome b subunit